MQDIYSGYQATLPFEPTVITHAPGRINIIGEHTDYNGGFVLPAAIKKTISVGIRKNGTVKDCTLYAIDLNESFSFSLDQMKPQSLSWANYVLGVISELRKLGAQFTGFDLAFGGNVPFGAGMSSSAALECAVGFALNTLFDLGFDRIQLVKVAQLAEHNYVGTMCGIMDQFASAMGKSNAVFRLDCRSLEYEYFPLELGDFELLFLNTNVSHSLADSAYNARRAACEEGVKILKQRYPEVEMLRDVNIKMLDSVQGQMSEEVYQRCRYIVEEIARVLKACDALQQKDFEELGNLIYQTHYGLQHLYEVSCPELDFLVDATRDKSYILGSRMMGGGFGGCTINLIKKGHAEAFIKEISPLYEAKFGLALTPIITEIGEGARISKAIGDLDFDENPHRRFNILTGEWVLVSPHRTKRPWNGKQETPDLGSRPSYDASCYLCPGNIRAGGIKNPDYEDVFVFQNDFGALLPDSTKGEFQDGLMQAQGEIGQCRVVCFSPDHSLTLPQMEVAAIERVIQLWSDQYQELGALPYVNHVQIFENKGAIMGCSNPHPHGQIWSQSSIPQEAKKKAIQQQIYWEKNGRSLLGDYLNQELEQADQRIITQNDHFVALVPFWATWPYECMIVPKRHFQAISQMTKSEQKSFAQILKALTIKLDNLFQTSFPYSSGLIQKPTDGQEHPWWHFHMSFFPPLLRSASVKKFMVGYEMFANPQRDISAEQAAEKIRSQSDVHYKKV
ncbi:MAG: hypothetical protein Sapg2KO_26830 [Saprospiraceae bacterium]